jgi:hypothetical protein
MSYHPKLVAEFGTRHGYDITDAAARKEIAEEYIKSGKAPSGIAASTVERHLEGFAKGERVGSYMPDGTTSTQDNTTHHMVPVPYAGGAQGAKCVYCGKKRWELVAELKDENVTQYQCPEAV